MFFSCVLFWAPGWQLFAKSSQMWLQKVSKMEPKAIQVNMVGPLQKYGRYLTDATLGHFGWGLITTLSSAAFRTPTFYTFFATLPEQSQKMSPNGTPLLRKNATFFDRSPKVAQLGSKGGQGLQKDTKMEPQVTKMESGDPKIQVSWPNKLLERGGSCVLSDS